jgi:hypothetical protein
MNVLFDLGGEDGIVREDCLRAILGVFVDGDVGPEIWEAVHAYAAAGGDRAGVILASRVAVPLPESAAALLVSEVSGRSWLRRELAQLAVQARIREFDAGCVADAALLALGDRRASEGVRLFGLLKATCGERQADRALTLVTDWLPIRGAAALDFASTVPDDVIVPALEAGLLDSTMELLEGGAAAERIMACAALMRWHARGLLVERTEEIKTRADGVVTELVESDVGSAVLNRLDALWQALES